jgi:hypothetical protein
MMITSTKVMDTKARERESERHLRMERQMKWASSEMKTNKRKARNSRSEPHGLSSIEPHTCHGHATHNRERPS